MGLRLGTEYCFLKACVKPYVIMKVLTDYNYIYNLIETLNLEMAIVVTVTWYRVIGYDAMSNWVISG